MCIDTTIALMTLKSLYFLKQKLPYFYSTMYGLAIKGNTTSSSCLMIMQSCNISLLLSTADCATDIL